MQDLQYRTFSSLMFATSKTLRTFADNNLITDSDYIHVARTVNSDLGIKINRIAEDVLSINNYKTELPEELLSIITAFVVFDNKCTLQNIDWQYLHNNCYMLCPMKNSLKYFTKYSINRNCKKSEYQIDVSERDLSFNFKEGKLYMAYTCDMVNEDGELLVLDHPLVNPYYESAIRTEILKDLWYNIDADTQLKYQNERDVELPKHKKKAIDIVTFPGYRKMKEYFRQVELEHARKWGMGII